MHLRRRLAPRSAPAAPRRRVSRLGSLIAFLLGSCGGPPKGPPGARRPPATRRRRGRRAGGAPRRPPPLRPTPPAPGRPSICSPTASTRSRTARDGWSSTPERSTSSSTSTADGRPPGCSARRTKGTRRRWWPGCRRCCSSRSTPTATARAARARRRDAVAHDARARPAAARLGVRERKAGRHARGRHRRASATTSRSRRRCCTSGDNRVRLTFRSAANVAGGKRAAAALTAVALGPAALRPPPGRARAGGGARRGSRRRAPARASCPAASSRVSFYLQLPAGAAARVRTGRADRRRPGAGARRGRRPAHAHRLRRQRDPASGPTRSSTSAPPAARPRASISVAQATDGIAWAEPRIVVKAPAAAAPPAPLPRFDHIFVWMVDTLRADKLRAYNPKSARADPELRRVRRGRDPLRVGAGPRHLVAAVARVAADRRLPDGAQGDRARGAPVQGGPLRRRGDEEGRLQDRDVLVERLHLVQVGVRPRLGHQPQLHPRIRSPTAPSTCGRRPRPGWSPASPSASSPTSRPSSPTSPTRPRRSSSPSTGTSPTWGRSSRRSPAFSSASSRAASSRSTTTTRPTSRRCTTARSPAATPPSRPSSPTSSRWGSTTSRR